MLSLFEGMIAKKPAPALRGHSNVRKLHAPDRSFTSVLSAARVLFLDVETTGLSWFYDDITLVGWMFDDEYKVIAAGDDPKTLFDDLRSADVIVTFNGTLFDLRFLRKSFGEIEMPRIHVDLRFLSKRAGLAGGQKAIERALGINFRGGVEDVDGAAAVLLWHDYLRGDERALERLTFYNRCDVLAMTVILDLVLSKLDLQGDFWLQRPSFGANATRALAAPLPTLRGPTSRGVPQFRTYGSLFDSTPAASARVVGIDLTGSERRGSGWCLLTGSTADIATMFTDAEMINAIVRTRPDLVSIDSPLSLPYGRNTVFDDDPARQEFGIMRRCERELKRRGINVYPSLLPSMQGLTARGMRLASRLREHGIPVIESYPGAAQDIMGIPRKGAGIEYLKRGLADFGIHGAFTSGQASHDELDAITAALVGSFFLAGKYEALRGPTEGALIVPDLEVAGDATLVVGLSGRICAGKTTASQMLVGRGFAYSRFSMVIDDEILARGGDLDRKTRQSIGEEIHRNRGQRWLCEKVLERVAGRSLIVVDGLRFPEDHAFFTETFGSSFLHVHISTDLDLRRLRYDLASQDAVTFDEAERQPVEGKIHLLENLAHTVINNDGTLGALEGTLDRTVQAAWKDVRCPSQSS